MSTNQSTLRELIKAKRTFSQWSVSFWIPGKPDENERNFYSPYKEEALMQLLVMVVSDELVVKLYRGTKVPLQYAFS